MSAPAEIVRDLLLLSLTPGLGPQRIAALIERFGSAEAALAAATEDLCAVPGIGAGIASTLASAARSGAAEAELERAARAGVRVVARGQPGYPQCLVDIPGAPVLLYVRGEVAAVDARAVALVGSRSCTDYGRRMAARLAAGLARAGVTVISGLA